MTENKRFILIICLLLSLGIITSLYVRNSIHEFSFDNIYALSTELSYRPYEDIRYSNGSFSEVTDTFDVIEDSNNIIIGKSTGVREVLAGAVKTQLKVIANVKGQLDYQYIYIYEPIDVSLINSYLFSYDGYNLIQNEKEYIFCLKKEIDGVYMFTTPMLAKFPTTFKEEDFLIIDIDELESNSLYHVFIGYEQLFASETEFNKYLYNYKRLMDFSSLIYNIPSSS